MALTTKGIAFDLEGTIVDLESAHHLGHLAAAAEFGVHLTLKDAIKTIPAFIGGPNLEVAKAISRLATREVDVEEILSRMAYHFQKYLRNSNPEPRPGFMQCLSRIKEMNIKVSLGSVTPKSEGLSLLEQIGLKIEFASDKLVFAEDVEETKPAPDVYLETASRMGILPSEQLVFEDSARGIEAAHRAGSRAIAVPVVHDQSFLSRLRAAKPLRIIWSWEDLQIEHIL